MQDTKIGTVSLRIQKNEPDSVDPTGYQVRLRSVGQPDLSLTVYATNVQMEDLRGNGHPLPQAVTAQNLTPGPRQPDPRPLETVRSLYERLKVLVDRGEGEEPIKFNTGDGSPTGVYRRTGRLEAASDLNGFVLDVYE